MRRIFQIIVFSNIWVAIAATAATITTLLTLQISVINNTFLLCFVFFSTLFIYIFQRLWRMTIVGDETNERLKWIMDHYGALRIIAIISFIAAIFFATSFTTQTFFLLAICGIISVLYVMKIFKVGEQRIMLRQLPFTKIFIVSLIWMMITVVLPLELNSSSNFQYSQFLFVSLERFLFIFAITLPFDIRDLHYDRKDALKTITSNLGVRKTKYLSVMLLFILSLLQFIYSYFENSYQYGQASAMSVSYLVTAIIIGVANEERKELFYSGLVESTILIQLIIISINLMIE